MNTLTTITITPQRKTAFKQTQKDYFTTKAIYKIVKQVERDAGNAVLQEHKFYFTDNNTGEEERLMDEFDAYLLNKDDFTAYLKLKHIKRLEMGISPKPVANIELWNVCIKGQILKELRAAEDALIDAGLAIMPDELRQQVETGRKIFKLRKKIIDLIICLDVDK